MNGLGGADILAVDSSNGVLALPDKIHFDAGDGFDELHLPGTEGVADPFFDQPDSAGNGVSNVTVDYGPGITQAVTIDDLGGWDQLNTTVFGSNGAFTKANKAAHG